MHAHCLQCKQLSALKHKHNTPLKAMSLAAFFVFPCSKKSSCLMHNTPTTSFLPLSNSEKPNRRKPHHLLQPLTIYYPRQSFASYHSDVEVDLSYGVFNRCRWSAISRFIKSQITRIARKGKSSRCMQQNIFSKVADFLLLSLHARDRSNRW